MLKFFEQFAELLEQVLAYLETDTGYEPQEINDVDVEIHPAGDCIVWFPEVGVRYFASYWNNGIHEADWMFSR